MPYIPNPKPFRNLIEKTTSSIVYPFERSILSSYNYGKVLLSKDVIRLSMTFFVHWNLVSAKHIPGIPGISHCSILISQFRSFY